MKICIVIPRYTISGVPLAQWRLARALAGRGHQVDLMVGYISPDLEPPLARGVKVIVLKQDKVRGMLISLCRYLLSDQPDLVFSAEDHLNSIVLLAAIMTRSKAKFSCSSRVTPFDTYSNNVLSKRWVLKQVMRSVMWRADALTCVSADMVKQYEEVFASPRHVAVYNIVDDRNSREMAQEPLEHEWFKNKEIPVIVAAGSLAPWKGFADLIHAVKIVSMKRRVRLLILGEGKLRSELELLITMVGLKEVVKLQGHEANPLKYFSRADVFVLSSHVEGLPNVLVEAIMCGCTVVSTDCPTGPREVLQDGKYGYLVPVRDPVAMAAAIERALDAPIAPDLLSLAVRPFKEEAVLEKHFEVLGLVG